MKSSVWLVVMSLLIFCSDTYMVLAKKEKKKKLDKNRELKMHSAIDEDLFCHGCMTVVGLAHLLLRGKTAESDVLSVMDKLCLADNYSEKDKYVKTDMAFVCKHIMNHFSDDLEEILRNRDVEKTREGMTKEELQSDQLNKVMKKFCDKDSITLACKHMKDGPEDEEQS